ncbi:hypothetical protein Taro_039577 [Colocasia esculenta]|uniref:Uncharacterized protein n=1 Tax=Colocasia esculenta TaxID=4460 RepID=A0A843WW49_COLES|nr:hypothetical protein [Colocasia esculenta]
MEECWVAGELWIDHKKDIFFPRLSATTCANRPLGVDQSLNLNRVKSGGRDLDVDQSTPRVGLRATWESTPL